MAGERVRRRLAAILAADIVGYSRLMQRDEIGTLAALKARRNTVIDPTIARYDGRIFNTAGDGVLAEFGSAVDAVQCAIDLQTAMAAKATGAGGEPGLVLRIGINLGDVLVDGTDLFGDGVNVAARIENIGEPGDILVSGAVHDYVKNKIQVAFRDLGLRTLKNLSEPVRVFRVEGTPQLSTERMRSALDKPSIVVLPFANLSGNPEQEYFSDGIAEDITIELSRFHSLLVISQNTSLAFKGKATRIQEVGRDLGVDYVVQGSVRRSANRVRVTAQLVETAAGTHVWAERYDRDMDDLFEIQDEITGSIVASVAPQLMSAEMRRAVSKRDSDLDTWDRLVKARWHIGKFDRDSNIAAQTLLAEVLAREPANSQAYTALALTHIAALIWSWSDVGEAITQAAQAAERALELDNADAAALAVLGLTLAFRRQFDDGVECITRAIELNPNLADAHGCLCVVHGISGRYEACVQAVSRACRLSPYDNGRALWLSGKGIGAFCAGYYDEVISNAGLILRDYPKYATAYRQRAAAYAASGRMEEAQHDMAILLALLPGLTISEVRRRVPLKEPEAMNRWLDALRKAGLPE